MPGSGFKLHLVFGALFLLASNVVSFAQQSDTSVTAYKDSVSLEGFVAASKSLSPNTVYIIRHNVKINNGATLTIPGNCKLLFDKGTSLVVEGGLNIAGKPNEFVEISSSDKNAQGVGILVRGSAGADITIKYAKFSKLSTPISFDMDWYRANVTIENNEFKELNTGESAILLNTPFNKLYNVMDKKTAFSFSYNNFVNNWGSIYIENLQDNVLDLHFNSNLVTNNVVYGVDMGVPTNTPVFGFYDASDKRFKAELKGNSIFGNYQINAATDTIIREVSIGVQGDGETFKVPNNFFRSSDPVYVSSTFDHFYQNNTLPLLTPEPISTEPSEAVHAHIWKVNLAGEEIKNYAELPANLPAKDVTFVITFNRAVTAFGNTQLESVFYDTINNGIKINPITVSNASFSNGNKTYTFTVDDASFMRNTLGYLVITNFKDADGFETPDFTIGQKKAINNYSKLFNNGTSNKYFSPSQMVAGGPSTFVPDTKDLEMLEDLSTLGDLSYLGAYTSLAKTWEVGLMFGVSNYNGTLTPKFIDRDHFQLAGGAFGQYNVNKWLSARATFLYARISGSDINDPEYGRRKRLANFRSDIYEGSLTVHFHILQYGISKGDKFSPSIFAGVGFFHHNPEGRIFTGLDPKSGEPTYLTQNDDGTYTNRSEKEAGRSKFVWVPLRAIGTEGQTSGKPDDGDLQYASRQAPKQYSLWQINFPMGIDLNFIINKSWVVGVNAGFRLTLTDYLDDVSGVYYDRKDNMQYIVDANASGISGNVGGKKITVEQQVTVNDKNGNQIQIPTAALISNPSLLYTLYRDPSTGNIVQDNGFNDAYTYPNGRKGKYGRDWYAFFGVTASKVFGYNKTDKKAAAQKDAATKK